MFRVPIVVGLSVAAVGLALLLTNSARSTAEPKHRADHMSPQSASRLEVELLVLRGDGFHPREITRPAGRFLLAIQNHSTAEDISLVFKQEGGVSIRELGISKRQSKRSEIVELPPGRYVLSETNHPDWNCTVIIRPN